MELYFSPFACSLASHIVSREAGLQVELRRVSIATKEIAGGGNFYDVNPKDQVPTLRR
ncbi:MAG: glutathione transferase GstA, partial [Alphaproteobacteria bacterium]|nr:glutathione transferase GstA [Alphaproteobacteria bacterium]